MSLGNRGGRKRKPVAQHLEAGTFRKDRHGGKHPQPQRGRPKCPSFLDAVAKKKFGELAAELDRIGMLTIVDGDALACYAVAWAEHQWACETLAKKGHVVVNPVTGVVKAHPAVTMQRTAWQALRQFAALYGLDPASRERLEAPASDAKTPTPKARFFEGQ